MASPSSSNPSKKSNGSHSTPSLDTSMKRQRRIPTRLSRMNSSRRLCCSRNRTICSLRKNTEASMKTPGPRPKESTRRVSHQSEIQKLKRGTTPTCTKSICNIPLTSHIITWDLKSLLRGCFRDLRAIILESSGPWISVTTTFLQIASPGSSRHCQKSNYRRA